MVSEALISYLCYFALIEGLEQHIKDWCMVSLSEDDVPGNLTDQQASVWRGLIFRKLVWGKLNLCIPSADNAIGAFFDVLDRKDAMKAEAGIQPGYNKNTTSVSPGYSLLSAWPASIHLRTALCSGGFDRTSDKLFERFQRFDARSSKGQASPAHDMDQAILAMYHPSRPNIQPFMRRLRAILPDTDKTVVPVVLNEVLRGRYGRFLLNQCMRAHRLASKHGQQTDARFIEHKFNKHIHDWTGGPPPKQWGARMDAAEQLTPVSHGAHTISGAKNQVRTTPGKGDVSSNRGFRRLQLDRLPSK